jgi:hypothetical protein
LDYIKGGEFLDWLSDYCLLKNDCTMELGLINNNMSSTAEIKTSNKVKNQNKLVYTHKRNVPGVTVATYRNLVMSCRMCGALPPHPIY